MLERRIRLLLRTRRSGRPTLERHLVPLTDVRSRTAQLLTVPLKGAAPRCLRHIYSSVRSNYPKNPYTDQGVDAGGAHADLRHHRPYPWHDTSLGFPALAA
ncbi:hypothetical protein MPL3356_150318 [Mesorhizobium plurifarium]|uniref:Uncharacterized protein n=1 Tax=Mesorhizobium plurifarium TaxID=69974 RepID=A0A090DFC8_MESPL|nr:hypothetical protein MPL3356_150318 [Mesorhizobium plurifarium]